MDWKKKFSQEIQMAVQARARGNEGQARVCARRAAGEAAREYFQRRGRTARAEPTGLAGITLSVRTSSAYDLLKALLEIPDLPDAARREAEFLTMRVTEAFQLPVEVDLLQSAVALAASLLPDVD